MIDTDGAYRELDRLGVKVWRTRFESETALAAPEGFLAIDPTKVESTRQELEILLHEIGHFETASFYQMDTPFADRQKQESKANRFVFEKYYPPARLAALMRRGHATAWELAEQLLLTERFVGEMLAFYTEVRRIDFNALAAEAEEAAVAPQQAYMDELLAARSAGAAGIAATRTATETDVQQALRIIGGLQGQDVPE